METKARPGGCVGFDGCGGDVGSSACIFPGKFSLLDVARLGYCPCVIYGRRRSGLHGPVWLSLDSEKEFTSVNPAVSGNAGKLLAVPLHA